MSWDASYVLLQELCDYFVLVDEPLLQPTDLLHLLLEQDSDHCRRLFCVFDVFKTGC
jgi:hypothetical protein